MKKIAIIGFGGHVKKNIIPAFKRSDKIEIDGIYVRDPGRYIEQSKDYRVKVGSVDTELEQHVEWVYISTPIATHFELATKYLKQNKNVICEKPLTTNADETQALFKLAQLNGVQLFEVCMYKYHKQYDHLVNTVEANYHSLKKVAVSFSIPHLPKSDIRYKKESGGGALLDVGYYPISLLISLFGKPKGIKSNSFSENGYDVDLSGVAIFEYDHFYALAEWGIGLPYSNQVTLFTDKKMFRYDRIFSKPETFVTQVEITEGVEKERIEIGSDDHFLNLLETLILDDVSKSDISTIVLTGETIEFLSI